MKRKLPFFLLWLSVFSSVLTAEEEKVFRIVNVASGLTLTVKGDLKEGSKLTQQEYKGEKTQLWRLEGPAPTLYRIISASEPLSLSCGKKADGAEPSILSNENQKPEIWTFSKERFQKNFLIGLSDELFLTVAENSKEEGARVIVTRNLSKDSQLWKIIAVK